MTAPLENVALNKPARQSSLSTVSALVNDAQGGVDGVKNGGFGFHTGFSERAWWEVDLLGVYDIEEIVVFNRLGELARRADTLRVRVSLDAVNWRTLPEWTGGRFGGVDGKPARIRPQDTSARYVRLELQEWSVLHLDEIEVYGRLQTGTGVTGEEDLFSADSFSF